LFYSKLAVSAKKALFLLNFGTVGTPYFKELLNEVILACVIESQSIKRERANYIQI
jgi:hypothetical protein